MFPERRAEMEADLRSVLADHLAPAPPDAAAWGWKEPRSIYLLRFWNEAMPDLRFLHFLRDGRDMAFSENQNQLNWHGRAVLGDELRKAKTPVRSIALWNRVNLAAADYGERVLGPRYLRVRFEDLCAEPAPDRGRDFRVLRARRRCRGRRGRSAPAFLSWSLAGAPEQDRRPADRDRQPSARAASATCSRPGALGGSDEMQPVSPGRAARPESGVLSRARIQ